MNVFAHVQVKKNLATSEIKIFIRDMLKRNDYEINLSSVLQSLKDKDIMNYIDKALKVKYNSGTFVFILFIDTSLTFYFEDFKRRENRANQVDLSNYFPR